MFTPSHPTAASGEFLVAGRSMASTRTSISIQGDINGDARMDFMIEAHTLYHGNPVFIL